MSEVTLVETEWRRIKCPFEKVRKFKTGVSIKCAVNSCIIWGKQTDQDDLVLEQMKVKRDCECMQCMYEMEQFLEVKP